MMKRDHPSNGNGSDPTAFTAHANKRNNASTRNQNHGRVGPKGGRRGRCYTCNKFGHYARKCTNRRDSSRYEDYNNNNNFRGNENQRNNRFKRKRKASSVRSGNGQSFKRSRNSRYDESNVIDNKRNEYILISALSDAFPSNTLDNWLIDSGASRHFTGYNEALSNLMKRIVNLELSLETMPPIL